MVQPNTKVLADLYCIVAYSRAFFHAQTILILNNESTAIQTVADAASHIEILDDCDILRIRCLLAEIVRWPPRIDTNKIRKVNVGYDDSIFTNLLHMLHPKLILQRMDL